MHRFTFIIIGLISISGIFAQSEANNISKEEPPASDSIHFSTLSASAFIKRILKQDNLWRPEGETMKYSLERLLDHLSEPFDSVESRLNNFKYNPVLDSLYIIQNDTLLLRWLNDSTFIIDTFALEKGLFIVEKLVKKRVIEEPALLAKDSLTEEEAFIDSLFKKYETITENYDTITKIIIDTAYIKSQNIELYSILGNQVLPPLGSSGSHKSFNFLPDSGKLIFSDTIKAIIASGKSPFYIVPNERMPDSLRRAVETILSYTNNRDSSLIYFRDILGERTPFWLTRGNEELYRYWVRNYKNDSVTVWMGNPSENEITLILEEDVDLNRLMREPAFNIPITLVKPQLSLAKLEPIKEIPIYWTYGFSSSFAMSQTYLSFWSKGGESSLISLLDIKGTAKYTDSENKKQWTNSGRLNYGSIVTEQNGWRTNTDILEFNSQYNKVLKKKVDLSAIFYMKNQIARGYKYPNDSVVVSKFLNPGTFTIGIGLEYKGLKNTSFNFSALSYKNTFVLDTAHIDQTIHGIAANERAKQEMGGQLLIKNNSKILDNLNIANSVRLFSGYLDEPQNIDVDWEVNMDWRINWYFSIALNLHMIYDDDIRFPVLGEDDQPIKLPDGTIKKSPKMQFKEFLGLTFAFKF